jgi:PhnB protein
MKTADPYLYFPGNTEEAFTFYRAVFGGEFTDLVRYGDFGDNAMGVPEDQLGRVAHVGLALGDALLMGTDVTDGRPFQAGNNFYITIEADTAAEADSLFRSLSEGGSVELPLQATAWAEQYGMCVDRFGTQWMVMYTGNAEMGNAR